MRRVVMIVAIALSHSRSRVRVPQRARTHSDYKLADPGDYEWPECKHITLRRTATKCTRGLWCGSGLPERLGWTDPERASGGHNRGEQRGDKHHPRGRRKKAGIKRHVVS